MPKYAYAVKFSGRVDRDAGIIYGVSVITCGMAKGHNEEVDAVTLNQVELCAKEFAGGLKVVDRHTKATDSVFATTGLLRNFHQDGSQLRADMHVLKSEPNRDKLFDMAEMMPDTFGISIAFSGPDCVINGKKYARCSEIYNAALVDVPAANPTGLFSADVVDASEKGNSPMTPDEIKTHVQAAVATALVEFGARVKAVEDAVKTSADKSSEYAALKQQITDIGASLETAKKEFAAKVEDDTKRIELAAKTVAQEFTRHTGSITLKADGGGSGTTNTPAPADKFVELAQKKFSETKSQAKALQLAIGEDPTGYAAFRSSGKNIKWA